MTEFITKDNKVIPINNSKNLSSDQLHIGTVGISSSNTVDASQILKQKEIGLEDLKKTIETRVDDKLDPKYALVIANTYEDLQHDPDDPEVRQAYNAFINDTLHQARILQKNGMQFDPKGSQDRCMNFGIECGQDGNYENSGELIKDVENNNHIFYRKSDNDYVGVEDHPMFKVVDIRNVDGEPMRANDVFRAVHDINGHVKGRVPFTPEGEIKAFLEHKKMYSAEGIKALFTETQGQGSWVNFNKNSGIENRHFQKSGELDRIKFPAQKAVVYPEGIIF